MLVLSRKKNEQIKIGDHITITVLRINGNVRLGIDAPDDVRILRGELTDFQAGTIDVQSMPPVEQESTLQRIVREKSNGHRR